MIRLQRVAAVILIAATSVLLSSGLATPRPVKAQAAVACIVSGSASISPGLAVTPVPQFIAFTGSGAAPCGGFGGTLNCGDLGENLATCAGLGAADVTSSPLGAGSGFFVQVGPYVEIHVITPFGGGVSIYWLWSSPGAGVPPIPEQNFLFTGDLAGVQG